jgi:threonine aldolase
VPEVEPLHWFRNDYSEGAHPRVLERLVTDNLTRTPGYGDDEISGAARAMIQVEIGRQDALVRFIPGGTQTNQLMIAHALRPHEAVIAAATGHINVHETGAIEATGHKVLTAPASDGKLTPELIAGVVNAHSGPHMVKPAMVYISDTTEVGTHYTLKELSAIREYCHANGLILYLDGARLSSALAASEGDLTIRDIASLTDCFYIGGTKNGALMGEALVITREDLKKDIDYTIKQRGAMAAKGRLLGLQFQALFEDGLSYEVGRHEDRMAARLRAGVERAGRALSSDSRSNQQFVLLTEAMVLKLSADFQFEIEGERDGMKIVRFVTSWSTTEADVDALIAA